MLLEQSAVPEGGDGGGARVGLPCPHAEVAILMSNDQVRYVSSANSSF